MLDKVQSVLRSPLAHDVKDGFKSAAISMVASLVLGGIVKGAVKLVEVAADAVNKQSQRV